MAKLPALSNLKILLDGTPIQELPRRYLGMSQLGSTCKRYLWYTFRQAYTRQIDPVRRRIFERGNLEEARVIADLKAVGVNVKQTQKQLVGYKSHCLGHIDGVVQNVPSLGHEELLLEIKTTNSKKFADFEKNGVAKASPQYFAQMQVYMLYLDLDKALFIITNKDNEQRYYEVVKFDNDLAFELLAVAETVVDSLYPPAKIGGPEWYECKWCPAYQICHFNEPMVEHCRTCTFATPKEEGEWLCTRTTTLLSQEEQVKRHECYTPTIPTTSGSFDY